MTKGKHSGKAHLLCSLTILLTIGLVSIANAQTSERVKEVYVKFNQGVISWPEKIQRRASDSTCIKSPNILSIVNQFGQSEIEKMFLDSDPDQVLVTNPAGIEIVKPTLKGLFKIIVTDSVHAFQVARDLSESDDALYAYQNGTRRPEEFIPNDDYFYRQWSLKNSGQLGGTPGADIKATQAWEHEKGSETVLIGMLDTGVMGDHPDLADGLYIVKRHYVHQSVSYPADWYSFVGVWDRGTASQGYTTEASNFGQLYSSVIDTTQTGFTLGTFVYEVWTMSGDYFGFVPCAPMDATMAYSYMGEFALEQIVDCEVDRYDWNNPCLKVSWLDESIGEEGFVLQRKDATSGVWSVLDTLSPSESGGWIYYEDSYILSSETYTYRVKAYTRNQTDVPWST